MSKLQKSFGVMGLESSQEETLETLKYANLIGTRVLRVCQKTSWQSKCLVQALTAQKILSKKNIHTTLYLGIRKENEELFAHAWLRCGYLCVTGRQNEEHTVVSTFYC